jgi:hypothetical protein
MIDAAHISKILESHSITKVGLIGRIKSGELNSE